MAYSLPPILLSIVILAYVLYKHYTRISLRKIPGPEPKSFILGNLVEVFHEQAGEADLKWMHRFGGIARIKGPFGEDMLWISDPKALQYIYQTSGYNFPKLPERRMVSRLVGGRGLSWADGETHRRHRKVMLPAFGAPEARPLVPLFRGCAERLASRWREILECSDGHSGVMNVPRWISLATLDAIGEAAFDYKFGALEDADNELAKAYVNLLAETCGTPSPGKIFLQSMAYFVPMRVQEFLYDNLPGNGLDKARTTKEVGRRVAQELIKMKMDAVAMDKTSRDVMSILVKANVSENEVTRLTEDEMVAQMRTIMLAGQETTSNTLSWALFELAKQPRVQSRLRDEIWAKETEIRERGGIDLTASDLDSMTYLQAVLREVLRFYPAVYHTYRQSGKDDILPLSRPVTTRSGEVIHEVPIPKSTRLVLSIIAYNRNSDAWGDDADKFIPERWLHRKVNHGPTLGAFSNLLTFAGGVRACIGWRFAVYELQSFLVELLTHFEFDVTDDLKRLRRESSVVMVPTLAGEIHKGAQLPLKVSLIQRE
ncbi:hypothetical protein CERSUDRAFT_161087 [Gelatoporia subvermispora B]|uniref:Cytochrome P450 n=1 Tax=Ceriporiopsis subvermispora (strain B) TaxID=914234 RepID=M2R473_CERS8|nr:hypothetical protein CERSUDRAFT_161087 [Gelatoporia subvermispora B]